MIHVDRNKIQVPEVFSSIEMVIAENALEEFYKGRKETRTQKRFSRQFEPYLREPILQSLQLLFNKKCAYCESKINSDKSSIYDHFRPKYGARGLEKEFAEEHYWWLTYEWKNFYYCCNECNQFKATWFPVEGKRARVRTPYEKLIIDENQLLIDPCNDDPREHLNFYNNGEVDFISAKGKVTIELLQLNRKKLIALRKKALLDLYGDWELYLKIWKQQEKNWAQIQDISKGWATILDESSSIPYIAARKQLLLDRFQNHPDILDFFNKKLYNSKLETRTIISSKHKDIVRRVEDTIKQIDISEKNLIESLPSILTKQVYLESIELQNFKCFDNLKLKFGKNLNTSPDNSLQSWHLFLGENGVGKSSILKAIAIALMGSKYRDGIREHITSAKLLKHGKRSGFIKILYNEGEEITVKFNNKSDEITSNISEPLTNVIGYGAIRLLPKKSIKPEQGVFEGIKLANLFDYTVAVGDASKWLLKTSQKDFDKAATSLKDLMLLDENSTIIRDRKINEILVLTNDSKPIAIDDLSDGYKTVFALSVDIIATLSTDNVTYDLAEGIVLIDEIGTHLHPRWKMEVVERLRKAFPKLQFVVSTHEPLCLRGLQANETIVLTKGENGSIMAISDLPDPSELRVDQILTSNFFGLNSTLDPKTERLFSEYYSILAKDEENRTNEDLIRMDMLSDMLPKRHFGDDLRDDLVYYIIDELLAKKVRNKDFKVNDIKEEALKKVESIWASIK